MTVMLVTRPGRRRGVLALVAALVLGGCGASGNGSDDAAAEDAAAGAEEATEETWPRTVELGGRSVEITAPPENVVAMSTETSDIVLELAGPERMAAVASGSVTEGAGNAIELAEQVDQTLPPGTTPDPEQILALGPDLVLMTGRHDGEEAAADVLEGSGVPTLVFGSEDFTTPRAVADSVRTLGEALGEEDVAEERAAAIEEQVSEVQDAVAGAEDPPRVLGLMARGDSVMITGVGSTLSTLTELAGGVPVAVEEGWQGTVPADPELILATEPDVILVEDFRGAGLGPFEGLLGSEALAGVPAIADDEIHLLPSTIASGSAGLRLGDGLAEVASILHPGLS